MTIVRPASGVIVEQWAVGVETWGKGFIYDIASPTDASFALEIDGVVDELMLDDIYSLNTITKPGDVWVDAGAHVGLFSIAAMQAGAEVAGIIDMDADLAWCAWRNVTAFRHQMELRGLLPSPGIVPAVLDEEIRSAQRLIDASMLPAPVWTSKQRSCLKLDVQGAEAAIFDGSGLADLAEAYDLIVFEWHHESTDHLLPIMEASGWQIDRVRSHTDVLLDCPTRIVWATSG